MSDLEGEVKPVLGSLIHDVALPLSEESQRVISAWSIKMGMVLEAIDRQRWKVYSTEERLALKSERVIPERSLIWLGCFSGKGFYVGGTDVQLDVGAITKAADGCVTTLIVGRVAIQVLTVHYTPQFTGRQFINCIANLPWDRFLVDIWPPKDRAIWPPPESLTHSGQSHFIKLRDRWRYGRPAARPAL
jgi:hypothetical protein